MDRTTRGLESGNGISSLKTYCHWSTALDTALHKDSPRDFTAHSSFSISRSKVSKRKQGVMSGAKGTGNPLLTLGLGSSPSSSDSSKLSSGTACVTSSSLIKDMDEESSVDLGLNLGFYVGNDIVPWQQKSHVGVKIMPLTNSPKLDLQLSLSTGSPESVIIDANMMSPDSLDMPMTNSSPVIMGKGSVPHNWGFEHSVVSSSYASEAAYAFPFPKKIDEGNASVPSPVISSTMFTSVKSTVASISETTNPQLRNSNTKNCQFPGCMKGARGASGRCIAHGGGRHCQKPGCLKGAEGTTIYCKAHGGGRRCQFLGCTKSAEGSTAFCKGHGGGKRCAFQGGGVCPKSVHGGTQYCVAHGGGKRCASTGCTKSARGRTEYCVRHGGGKRCKSEGCTKSAQGSTDFCKAHGGGKRCSWGQAEVSFGIGTQQCDRFVRSKTGFCSAHSALVQDHCVHGGGTLGPAIHQFVADVKPTEMKVAAVQVDPHEKTIHGDQALLGVGGSVPNGVHPSVLAQPMIYPLPEGRVHGGGLLALLSQGRSSTSAGGSENCASGKISWM
ncbi:hypothetical protein PVAP13_5NG280400 [Panicum virgatum]|uniref:WRKY19-like zinc finger domain-containing protein n=1 Tax=Panicum virgatum TaxID=38727 RepID=A0A8T0RUX0_PANVG|nr:hypothetical protein PVAP13_5NG280400 [Panicum virgatum]